MHSSSSIIEQHEQHDEQQQQQEGHLLTPWKSADQPPVKKKSSFRRLSFFKPSSSSNSSTTPSTPTLLTSPVLTTNTINKEYDPETGNKVINNFMIIKEIGRGMHGKVKLAQDLDTGELVAIKIVDKASRKRQLGYSILRENNNNKENNSSTFLEESEQKIRREIAILKKCAHPHVVKLREVIDDPLSRKIYLALEYMQGGEIIWRNEDEDTPVMTHSEAKSIFRDVISGLDYLHYQGIIHRDIKPANLLLTKEKIVKISDFGVSYFSQHLAKGGVEYNDEIDRELAETVGTPAFFAPELCCCTSSDQHSTHITKAIDVWALGVTLYCFIFGQCPFTASTEFELFDIIPTQPLTFPTDIPSSLQDLLERLLTKDSQERITLQEVKQHPWVIEDVQDVDAWLKESDPTLYQTVQVTDEDVSHAVTTIMDKLKRSIHRISSSLFHSFNNERKHSRSKSNTSFVTTPSSSSDIIINSSSSPISHSQYHHQQHPHHLYEEEDDDDDYEFDHEEQEREERKGGGQWIPKSFTNMTLLSSSSSSSSSDLKGAATAQDQQQQQQIPSSKYPFQIDRNGSSGSSMSGLVVSFNNNAGSNKK